MNNMHKFLKTLPVIAVAWLLAMGSGSAPIRSTTDFTRQEIKSGILANEDLRIVAEDGSWTLEGGKNFPTPFSIDGWGGSNAFAVEAKMLDNYKAALQSGAKRVLVFQKGHEKPLYGVLALNKAINAAYGPAAQSYLIQVADAKLKQARDGVTTVSYENMDWKTSWSDGSSSTNYWYGWALWLSAFPL